ncbi:MAG: phage recombination protein Bet [Eggerthellaceae bacterium]|nr:phage recombination protein Bet [Eggerthellaceae bacterium]
MTSELAKTYKASDGQEITLTPAYVAQLVLGGNADNVPDSEYAKVIMTCAARGLNPLAGDVAVQPWYDKNKGYNVLTVVPTKDYFQRRAEAHPSYLGKEYGVVVFNAQEHKLMHKRGTGVYPELGEQLLGGWCRVFVKGHEHPEYAEVSLDEYDQNYALWKTKTATMIAKVAKSQALREAFPNEFQGLYEPEEIGIVLNSDGELVDEDDEAVAVKESVRIPLYEGPQEVLYETQADQSYGPDGWGEMNEEEREAYVESVAARADGMEAF